MRTFWAWLVRLLSLRPHYFIGGAENPYMLRWFLIPRNKRLNVYLHKFMRDDDDRALHDHPWWFVSLVVWGHYLEWREDGWPHFRGFGNLAYRAATARHRISLIDARPCWTLVITGPVMREWGFWCPKGFVRADDFVSADDRGAIGKGCGE